MALTTARFVDVHPHTAWCPRTGCGASVLLRIPLTSTAAASPLDGSESEGRPILHDPERLGAAVASGRGLGVDCGQCGTQFCFECSRSPPHEPASCNQVCTRYLRTCWMRN